MCIVTYLPLQGESFILVSSREELPSRASTPPSIYKNSSGEALYPKDPLSNGTWIAASSNGKVACLLNGAFDAYAKKSSYKHSRGLIPLKYLQHKSFLNFYFQYDLREIEPFTVIAYEDKSLFELKWDGQKHFVKNLIHKAPHIWSSVTLYSREVIDSREKGFMEWTKSIGEYNIDNILSFHKNEKREFLGQAAKVQTLSTTALIYKEKEVKMIYEDLATGNVNEAVLKL